MNEGFLVVAGFFGLFVLGMPVAFAILVPSVIYITFMGIPMAMVAQRILYALDSFPLVAVPVFIFVGNLMNAAGITERLFRFADVLVGRLYGGLGQVNVFASLIFSGVSGAALADVGGLGRVEIKAMSDRGLPAAVLGRGHRGVRHHRTDLPALDPDHHLCVGHFRLGSAAPRRRHRARARRRRAADGHGCDHCARPRLSAGRPLADASERLWDAFVPAAPALLAPVILIGGMLSGHFTPTETSAVAVVYVLVIGMVFYRSMGFGFVLKAATETVRSTAAILFIVAAAAMFGWILTVEGVPREVATFFAALGTDPWVLLLVVNVIFLVAGMFVDSTTATLLLVPIIAPPLVLAGIDPVHLGIVDHLQPDVRHGDAALRPVAVPAGEHDGALLQPARPRDGALLPGAGGGAPPPHVRSGAVALDPLDAALRETHSWQPSALSASASWGRASWNG